MIFFHYNIFLFHSQVIICSCRHSCIWVTSKLNVNTSKTLGFYFSLSCLSISLQVIFEFNSNSSSPVIPHRIDQELTVKFDFRGSSSDANASSNDAEASASMTQGDMVALYDADEMERNAGRLDNPKAVAFVGYEGCRRYRSVTFQRKFAFFLQSFCFYKSVV